MPELVPGAAFWTSPRPRVRCEDCGRRVTYCAAGELPASVPADVVRRLAQVATDGGSVYWCSCGLVGAFTGAWLA